MYSCCSVLPAPLHSSSLGAKYLSRRPTGAAADEPRAADFRKWSLLRSCGSRLTAMTLGGQAVNGSRSDDVIDLMEGHVKTPRVAWALTAISLVLLVILVGHAWPATAQTVGPESLVDGFVRAFNTHDAKTFGSLFAEDADWVSVAGIRVKGRAKIQAEHEEAFNTFFKMTTLASTGTEVRLVRPEVAVLHFNWELNGQLDPEGKPRNPRRGIITIVAVKQVDGWKISAGQNTNALPPG